MKNPFAEPDVMTTAPLILVVDDVPKNVQLLGKILSDEGYRVAVAMDGKQALHSISLNRPDLILLDVMMPEMDGYEVCRRLRDEGLLPGIPVVFLTARNGVEDVVAAFDSGAVDFITKPFQIKEVLARVRTQVQLKQARDVIHKFNDELQTLLEDRTRHLLQSERQAAFGQMVQGIVHNLRSPLTAVSMAIETMELARSRCDASVASGEERERDALRNLATVVQRTAQIISSSNSRLNGMLHSLLAKSRSDKSSELKVMDLGEILRLEVEFLNADMRFKHEVQREIVWHEEPLTVQVVPGEIAQVFQNIVRNGLDALWDSPSPHLTITTSRRGPDAAFSVSDNGPGIPPELRNRIFDPFFTTKAAREDHTTDSRKPLGTGLGLWMCQETVTSYNGRIEVDTETGRGTTFTVLLPLADAAA